MMHDRDFILRMVREFATFLARIVRTREEAPERRTIADLDDAARSFVGLGLHALEVVPTDQVMLLLGADGALDVNRAYAAGRLLQERAGMAARAGSGDLARTMDEKALRLLTGAALAFGGYLNDEHRAAIVDVTDRALERAEPLAPRTLCDLFEVHLQHDEGARIRRLAEALRERTAQALGPEPLDPMSAVRVALRGGCPMLLGRLAPVLEAAVGRE